MDTVAARMTPAIKAIVALNVIAFLVFLLVHEVRVAMLELLSVTPDLRHAPWQPLTAMFLQDGRSGTGFFSLLLDVVALWFVGGDIERRRGTPRFLLLFFGSGILANVATALVARKFGAVNIYMGPSTAILALFVAYGRLLGPVPVPLFGNFVVTATRIAQFWVVVALLMGLGARDAPGVAGTIVGVACGYLLAAPGGLSSALEGWRARRARKRYQVLEGGAAPPRRGTGRRAQKYWN